MDRHSFARSLGMGNCELGAQGGAPPSYKWLIIPWKLVRYITNKNHSDIGLIGTNLANYGAPPCRQLRFGCDVAATKNCVFFLQPLSARFFQVTATTGAPTSRDFASQVKRSQRISKKRRFNLSDMSKILGFSRCQLGKYALLCICKICVYIGDYTYTCSGWWIISNYPDWRLVRGLWWEYIGMIRIYNDIQ